MSNRPTPKEATKPPTGALESRPENTNEGATVKNATDPQMDYIESLMSQVHMSDEARAKAESDLAAGITSFNASRWIDRLETLRKEQGQSGVRSRSPRSSEPEAGMYKSEDGTILRVYLGQKSGRMLLKRLVEPEYEGDSWSYEYVGAAARRLPADAKPLPLEEAKRFGKMTGTCCVCARRLDNPESVDAGIGPVCAGRVS